MSEPLLRALEAVQAHARVTARHSTIGNPRAVVEWCGSEIEKINARWAADIAIGRALVDALPNFVKLSDQEACDLGARARELTTDQETPDA